VQQNTFVQNNIKNVTVVNNVTMIAPPAQVAAKKEQKLVALDHSTRHAARAQAQNVQQVAAQRSVSEVKTPPGAPRVARTASLSVPKTEPVKPGMKAPPVVHRPAEGARLGAPTPGRMTPSVPKTVPAATATTPAPKATPGAVTPTPTPTLTPTPMPKATPPMPARAAPPKAAPKPAPKPKDKDKKG
jgi:hypothetical protein